MGRYFGGPLISGYPYGIWRFPRKGLFYGTTFGVSITSLAWERGALGRQALFSALGNGDFIGFARCLLRWEGTTIGSSSSRLDILHVR